MEVLWLAVVAGFAGGLLVMLTERLIFRPRESWKQLRAAERHLRHNVLKAIGRNRCPECLDSKIRFHDVDVDPIHDPVTGEIVNGRLLAIYSCQACGHGWSEVPGSPATGAEL